METENSALKEELSQVRDLLQKKDDLLSKKDNLLSKKDDLLSKKESDIERYKAEIARLRRMIFGQKRERFQVSDPGQLTLPFEFEDKEIEVEVEKIQQQKEASKPKDKKPHPGRLKLPSNLEVRETVIEPEGDLSEMICIGEEITEELEMEPAKYYIHRIIRRKYAPKSGEGAFKIASLPDRVIDKGIAGAGIITQAIIDKYVDHLPVYRQIQRFSREGIPINESTLHHWIGRGIGKLEILYGYLWQRILKTGYLQVDETTIKVLESEKKNAAHLGYYWVYHDPIAQIPVFRYEAGRSGELVTAQLADFKGFLQTDGYAGYSKLARKEQITHVSCWAHVRREFERALNNDKPKAETALLLIQKLYETEREAAAFTPESRKELRLEKSLPVLNTFFRWAAQENMKTLPKSQIGKAISYALERYESLLAYLYNGELHIDNNAVENSIRPIALGRKNYLFCKTHDSAQRGAIIYTFMAICKKHNVNPFLWLKNTLTKIDDTSIQKLHTLLPQYNMKQDGLG